MAKSASALLITKSVGDELEETRLVMNAKTTWLYGLISSVKQTAGRTLFAVKSSNGNGTRTILYFICQTVFRLLEYKYLRPVHSENQTPDSLKPLVAIRFR